MPDLLLELFSEEIPARMQARAMEDLQKLVTGRLVDAGLTYEGAKGFVTPRRLALAVHGLPARQPDLREEKKGPRVGAPEKAIEGFLKSAGLKSISEAKVQPDKKGDFYVALIERKGRPAEQVIAEIVPQVVRDFPWPKSMRWGAGELTWVRPLHSIVCVFGPETEEPEVVKFAVDGVASGDTTYGHRVMAPAAIRVRRLEDYLAKLEKAKVVPDRERRKAAILADAKDLALAQGLELVEDEGLLEEVAGLVEWPVALLSEFDAAYLELPPEVIRATIRANQKCFVLRDPKTGKLANKFVLVADLEAKDGGAAIKAGNARVIRARLADAKFFYEQDRKKKLEERLPKLEGNRLSREAGDASGARGAHRKARERFGANSQSRSRQGRTRRATFQGRPRHRDGGRVPRTARIDGQVLRAGPRRGRGRRPRHRGALQAAGARRSHPDRPGFHRGRPRRQDRYAGWLLDDRREADGIEGSLCAAPRGAGRDTRSVK